MHLNVEITLGTPKMIEKNIMARAKVLVHSDKAGEPIFEINDIMVRNKDGELWVAMPTERYTVNGETRYKRIVRVGPNETRNGPTPIQDKFRKVVLDFYNKAVEKAKAATVNVAVPPADQGEPEF